MLNAEFWMSNVGWWKLEAEEIENWEMKVENGLGAGMNGWFDD